MRPERIQPMMNAHEDGGNGGATGKTPVAGEAVQTVFMAARSTDIAGTPIGAAHREPVRSVHGQDVNFVDVMNA